MSTTIYYVTSNSSKFEEVKRYIQMYEPSIHLEQAALDIDEMFAQLLISEGFETIEEIATIDIDEFLGHSLLIFVVEVLQCLPCNLEIP